jgi:3,8-divinyl chlorophyllide a/chlorophyllide a reductase subunit Y
MKTFFGDVGQGDQAGIWETKPVAHPEFKAQVRRQLQKKKAKAASEAIGT